MKKILIEPAASFFFALPEKRISVGRELKSYIEAQLEKEYPADADGIVWGCRVFTFEKRKFALVTVADKESYEELKVMHHSCTFVTEVSAIASGKSFTDGGASYTKAGLKVFYDIEAHEPRILFTESPDRSVSCLSGKDIQKAAPAFGTEGYGKYLAAAAAACAAMLCIVLLLRSCDAPASQGTAATAAERTAGAAAEAYEQEVRAYSSLSSFLGISRLLSDSGCLVEHFSEDAQGHVVLKTKTKSPSALLEKISGSGLYSNVSVTSMQKDAGSTAFSCTFEMTADKPASSGAAEPALMERMADMIPAMKNAETAGNSFVLKTGTEGLDSFMRRYSDFESGSDVMLGRFSIDGDGSEITIKGDLVKAGGDVRTGALESSALDGAAAAVFCRKVSPVKAAAPAVRRLPENNGMTEVGRIRNDDGTYTIYMKTKEGKIVQERSK